ncbi:MAG: type II toxin-antitoxin system prevent-host-death family antitoxin [Candidatus Pacebacteria bacterium]|nr:type II toxin-antitoxin system prevent-host-death family antitoxin [Candidatus Paceibacterota bacterium]
MRTKNVKDNIVGVKELRQNLDEYIAQVGKGKSFTVFRRSKPVFKITPVIPEEDMWETVIDFTKIKKGGVLLTEVRQALSRLD